MARGFAAIGLHQPKDDKNCGEVLRAAGCYGAGLVAIGGARYRAAATDTQRAYRHMPVLRCDSLRQAIPMGATCIAVDMVDDATELQDFQHPEAAFYIFGPEDGTLGPDVLAWCTQRVYVPTRYCMNLAATVNVVLYDRMSKQRRPA